MNGPRLCLLLLIAAGCRGRNPASALAQTPELDAQGQSRCGVMKSRDAPLIIEWPSSDRGALESLLHDEREGLVAVRYEGCEMQLLRRCAVAGSYGYTGLGVKRDDQTFRSADELYAKIPLGAAHLEGELERHGALALKMTVVGRYEAGRSQVDRGELRGDCEQATHVISAVTVGAFRLATEAGAEVSAGAGIYDAQAGYGSSAERGFERSDGEPRRCGGGDSASPPSECKALLRLEVEPIREAEEVAARREQRPCPRGTVLVEGGRFAWHPHPRVGVRMAPEVVTISDFCMDVHEVTVGDYAACADDGPCSAAATTPWHAGMKMERSNALGVLCNGDRYTRRRHPVNCVNWHQAETYCRAQGGRLPSEQEWEWAARGGEQARTYAWGEERPGPALVNACDEECARRLTELQGAEAWPSLYAGKDGDPGTAKVGSRPRGAGRGRVVDLAGNVWEWTATAESAYVSSEDRYVGGGVVAVAPAEKRVIRGGGFTSGEDRDVRVEAHDVIDARDRQVDVGFRCVRDP